MGAKITMSFRRAATVIVAAMSCSPAPRAEEVPTPPEKPAIHGSDPDCRERLSALGVVLNERARIPPPSQPACAVSEPVAITAIMGLPGNPRVVLAGTPVLACAMAERFAQFVLDVADPASRQVLGAGITSIDAGPGYVCRSRNNQPGAKLSSHAQGLAVDLMSVTMEGGKTISLAAPAQSEQRDVIAHITARACAHFNTVLGIGSDAFHGNNIHIDLEPRGRDGNTKFCR